MIILGCFGGYHHFRNPHMDAKRNNKKMHRSQVDIKPFVPDVQGCREPPRINRDCWNDLASCTVVSWSLPGGKNRVGFSCIKRVFIAKKDGYLWQPGRKWKWPYIACKGNELINIEVYGKLPVFNWLLIKERISQGLSFNKFEPFACSRLQTEEHWRNLARLRLASRRGCLKIMRKQIDLHF